MPAIAIPASDARMRVTESDLPFSSTEELDAEPSMVGQERARAAIELALRLDGRPFHLFVAGPVGSGRSTMVPQIAQRFAEQKPTPPDWCLIHNFAQPDQPIALRLPAGQGRLLAVEMKKLVESLEKRIPAALTSRAYRGKHQTSLERALDQRRGHFERLEAAARALGIGVEDTTQTIQLVPLRDDGTAMEPEQYEALAESDKKAIDERERKLRDDLLEFLDQAKRIQETADAEMEALDRRTVSQVLSPRVTRIRRKYAGNKVIETYLEAVVDSVVESLEAWVPDDEGPSEVLLDRLQRTQESRNRYRVNVLVDHSDSKHGLVIFERHPTYANLIGRSERKMTLGALETDHTLVRAGSLLKASGGILIAHARELVSAPNAWPALKRAIREQRLVIEDPEETQPGLAAVSLKPAPIQLSVKLVLIGSMEDCEVLREIDEEFGKLFRVRADFEESTQRTPARMLEIARYVASQVAQHRLRPFAASGVAAVLEEASRAAGRQDRLTLQLDGLTDLIIEAELFALDRGAPRVERADVVAAEAGRRYREGMYRESMLREFERRQLLVEVSGRRVGQVNGLAVVRVGDVSFGFPARITAKTFVGSSGLVNIEREADLSGEIHSKAVLILNGYLGGTYARHRALALSASVTFEQSYALIEGDSASLAELLALLSSLAGAPARQDVAITGSLSQHGEVQPIGGINEKIEGFFDVCRIDGLTGTQGVMIPSRSAPELQLRDDVVEAIAQGRFNVWKVECVEDAIELLLGLEAGVADRNGEFAPETLHGRVMKRLAEMADAAEGKPRRRAKAAPRRRAAAPAAAREPGQGRGSIDEGGSR
jgi:lon-related putative ATP-dependent protease